MRVEFSPEVVAHQDNNQEYYFTYGAVVLAAPIKAQEAITRSFPVQGFHVEDRERVFREAANIKEGQEPVEIQYKVIRKDGAERIFRNRVKLIRTERGDKIFVGTTQDVTEEEEGG